MRDTRRTEVIALTLAAVALVAILVAWCAHPICMPLSRAEVAEAAKWMPLEQRTERQWHGPIWQQHDGTWYQCKSWISRQFFF